MDGGLGCRWAGGGAHCYRAEREAICKVVGRRERSNIDVKGEEGGHVCKLRDDLGESSCVSHYLVKGL